jgi:hypothetical protein
MTAIHALLIVAAAANLVWSVRSWLLASASTGWPTTRGRLVKCYIDERRFNLRLAIDESDGDGEEESDSHAVKVAYTYRVAGTTYQSTRLTYRPTRGMRFADAIASLEGLRAGQDVDVHYDPRHPARSVIIAGASTGNELRIAFAVLILGLAIWLALATPAA